MTYELGTENGSAFILCSICKAKSFHPGDIEHRYCGRCHEYHPIGKLISMTHDEMVVEVPSRLVEYPPLPTDLVPLTADVKLGDTWK